jgi:hypothetical protein
VLGLIQKFDLSGDRKVVEIVGRIAADVKWYRRRVNLRIDGEEILDGPLDLYLDIGGESLTDADIADAGQIAFQPRQREFHILDEIDAGADLDRALRRDVDIVR